MTQQVVCGCKPPKLITVRNGRVNCRDCGLNEPLPEHKCSTCEHAKFDTKNHGDCVAQPRVTLVLPASIQPVPSVEGWLATKRHRISPGMGEDCVMWRLR